MYKSLTSCAKLSPVLHSGVDTFRAPPAHQPKQPKKSPKAYIYSFKALF